MALSSAFYSVPFQRRWDLFDFPARICDQHFGTGFFDTDLLPPILTRGYVVRPRTQSNIDCSGHSEVINESDKFQINLNVSHFSPEELSVKTSDNCVVIHGKHEEKSDEHGFISREFTRRYVLPEGAEPETVVSSLSDKGILTVKAPKKALEDRPANERVVPVTMQENPAVEADGQK